MASRYSQQYFFQHSLMNIPFTDSNEIIHPNAESIPEHIRHFASAIFVNESFWNNPNAVTQELQMEANSNDYISTYLSYISMLQATYKLVTNILLVFRSHGYLIVYFIFLNRYHYKQFSRIKTL